MSAVPSLQCACKCVISRQSDITRHHRLLGSSGENCRASRWPVEACGRRLSFVGGNGRRVIGSGECGRRTRGSWRSPEATRAQSSAPTTSVSSTSPSLLTTTIMQSLVAARSSVLRQSARGFASSAARAQATPLQKPVLNKEFKIYRWVCRSVLGLSAAFSVPGKEADDALPGAEPG